MEEPAPCYFIFKPREDHFWFSFKKNPDDELKIQTCEWGRVVLEGVEPGRYYIVYQSAKNKYRKGMFVVDIKKDQFLSVVIPPYGK